MGLESQNPQYAQHVEDWATMRDLYKGERVVKDRGEVYLPATAGMHLDNMNIGKPGRLAYDAYKMRAVFHDYVREGVEALIGLLHQKEATIELPALMEGMRKRATVTGESLLMLLRRINEQQLITGRIGLLLDMPATPSATAPLPYVATYIAETIHNWDDNDHGDGVQSLNLVVLNETSPMRDSEFNWQEKVKYRVLMLGELEGQEAAGGVYQQGVFDDNTFTPENMKPPLVRGAPLKKIPFVFVNSKDIVATPDEPPLMGLGRLALAIYRGEADYRQNLYMQGQDTLVTIGGVRNANGLPGEDDAIRTGAGSRIDCEIGGDAKYIGTSSQGLSEQRQALEADKARAATKAGQLINNKGTNVESGEALTTRLAAQTATLNQIALAGAAGLEHLLRIAAEWMGANPDEVKVTPNVEFADFDLSGQEIVYLMSARSMGAPLSKESIHALMVDRGITKLDYETEMGLIEEEDAVMPPPGTNAGGDPNANDPNKKPGEGGTKQ